MPSKKRKYNARFPAGRIKKIMQTDEEVGKVAQAVPIIIYLFLPTPRTLELFVESLLTKAKQVTMARNAKTLSPSHVKQCILAESRFDFLKDLVKNIPDVSAAEEKEMISAESSPNSSRFSDTSVPPRRIAREDSNSSSSSDVKVLVPQPPRDIRAPSAETELPLRPHRTEIPSTVVSTDTAIDLSKKYTEEKVVRTANFYQETLLTDEVQHRSVIQVNPTYSSPQPSTSYTSVVEPKIVPKIDPIEVPKPDAFYYLDVKHNNNIPAPRTPVTPILNIDFTKNPANPEIKVIDTAVASIVGVPKNEAPKNSFKHLPRQNSKPHKEIKKDIKPVPQVLPVNIDHFNTGNLQIDEDYDT